MVKTVTVTKNSFYSLVSSIIQKALTLVYFIVVARMFGPADQGRYSAALAFTMLFNVLIDLGVASVLTRETARAPEKAYMYVNQMFISRICIGVLVYGIIIVSAIALGYSSEFIHLVLIAGIATMFDALSTASWAVFRGLRNLFYESVGGVLAIAIMMSGGIAAMVFHLPIYYLMYAVLAGSLGNFLYVLWLFFFKARFPLSLRPDFGVMKKLFIYALPFMGAAIFSRIYTFSDTAIIAKMAGDQYAGWYSAGNKIILALNLVPASLSASLFPVMSAYFVHTPEKIGTLYVRALIYLFMIAAPMGVGIALLSKSIVATLYGVAYTPTVGVLQVLSLSIVFGFLIYPPGSVLAAVNRQKINTMIYGAAAAINIVTNIFLIPSLGALGAAIASVFSNGYIVLASLIMTRPYWIGHWKHLIVAFMKILLATGGMGVLVSIMAGRLPLLYAVILGMVSYAFFVFLLDVFPKKEYAYLYRSLIRKV